MDSMELTEHAFNDIQQIIESTVGDLQFSDFDEQKFLIYVAQVIKVSYSIGVRDGIQKR